MDTINSTASVRSQLLGLQHLTMEELIEKWKMLFHKDPPQYGEVFMRRRLAHRIHRRQSWKICCSGKSVPCSPNRKSSPG